MSDNSGPLPGGIEREGSGFNVGGQYHADYNSAMIDRNSRAPLAGEQEFYNLIFFLFFAAPVICTTIATTVFFAFKGIIGRIWQTLLFGAFVGLLITGIIMEFAAPGITSTEFYTGLFSKDMPFISWHFVFFVLAALAAVYYFIFHYRAIRCTEGDVCSFLLHSFSIMYFGSFAMQLLGMVLPFLRNNTVMLLVLGTAAGAYYFIRMWPYIVEGHDLSDTLPPEVDMTIVSKLMMTFQKGIIIAFTFFPLFMCLLGLVWVSTYEILIPAGIMGDSWNPLMIALLSSIVVIPVLFFISAKFQWKIVFLLLLVVLLSGPVFFVRSFFTQTFPTFVYEMANVEIPNAVRLNMRDYESRIKMPLNVTSIPNSTTISSWGKTTALRSEPVRGADVIKQIPDGETVSLTGIASGNRMMEVRHGEDSGWVAESALGVGQYSFLNDIYFIRRGENIFNIDPYDTTIKSKRARFFLYSYGEPSNYQGPRSDYVIRTLNQGDPVRLTGRASGNFMVEVSYDGRSGWVGESHLAEQPNLRRILREMRNSQ